MSNRTPSDEDDAHLRDIPDGAGCTEIWEHLTNGRDEDPSGGDDPDESIEGVQDH